MKKKWYDDSFWHRDVIDLWTIPHSISGTIPFFVCAIWGYNMLLGFLVTIVIAIIWEIGEAVVGVSSNEVFSNKVTDVIIAGVGYGLIWGWSFIFHPEQESIHSIFLIALVLLIVTCVIGWTGYYLGHRKG